MLFATVSYHAVETGKLTHWSGKQINELDDIHDLRRRKKKKMTVTSVCQLMKLKWPTQNKKIGIIIN